MKFIIGEKVIISDNIGSEHKSVYIGHKGFVVDIHKNDKKLHKYLVKTNKMKKNGYEPEFCWFSAKELESIPFYTIIQKKD